MRDVVAIFVHLVHSAYTKCVKACRNKGLSSSIHPSSERGNINFIYSLVPVYNEDLDMVTKNLDSLVAQKLPADTTNKVILIFDGLNDKNTGLFNSINNLVVYDPEASLVAESSYYSWKTSDTCKLMYRSGTYKGLGIVVAHKSVNKGKKDSLIVGEKLIENMYADDHDIIFSHGYEHTSSSAFVYHTDGDTVADENCLGELIGSLLEDDTLDGVSSLIRVYNRGGLSREAWTFAVMQDFQYFYSLMVRRMGESAFSATTCLPGCSNMIRLDFKTTAAIHNYGRTPTDTGGLLQTVTRMQGTDRRYTVLMLREGARLKMNHKAVVYTEPPLDVGGFIRQRRRWSSNSFFNSVVMLYSQNMSIYVKFSSFIDVCRMFSTIFRLVSYIIFWFYLGEFSIYNIILAGVFLVFPYMYCFMWAFFIVPNWMYIIAGFFLNKIFMPVLSVTSISKMYMTATNFDWGFKPSDVSNLSGVSGTTGVDEDDIETTVVNPMLVQNSSQIIVQNKMKPIIPVTVNPVVINPEVSVDSEMSVASDVSEVSMVSMVSAVTV